jgi:hypothetical protein
MKTKLLVVLFVVGATLLTKADAQPPGNPLQGGGTTGGLGGIGPGTTGAPGGSTTIGVGGLQPGALGGTTTGGFGSALGVQQPGGTNPFRGGGTGAAPQPGGTTPGAGAWATTALAPAWEYKFVDVKSDRKEFEKAITQQGKDGWEFCSSERFGQNDLVLVFKKRKGGDFPFGGRGGFGFGGFEPGGGFGVPAFGGDVESRVHKLKNAAAADVVAAVNKAFPKAKGLVVVAEPVSNAVIVVADPATLKDIVKLIESLDAKGAKPGPGPMGPGPGGPGGPKFPTPGGPGPMGPGGPTFPGGPGGGVVPGPVGGPPGAKAGAPLHVYTLKHATAAELADVLKKLFANADITSDPRTNSLIVRADQNTHETIEALVARLDVEVPRKK